MKHAVPNWIRHITNECTYHRLPIVIRRQNCLPKPSQTGIYITQGVRGERKARRVRRSAVHSRVDGLASCAVKGPGTRASPIRSLSSNSLNGRSFISPLLPLLLSTRSRRRLGARPLVCLVFSAGASPPAKQLSVPGFRGGTRNPRSSSIENHSRRVGRRLYSSGIGIARDRSSRGARDRPRSFDRDSPGPRRTDNILPIPYTRPWRFLSTVDKLLSLLDPQLPSHLPSIERGPLSPPGYVQGLSSAVPMQPSGIRAHLNINLPLHCPLLLLTYLTDFYFYCFPRTSDLSPFVSPLPRLMFDIFGTIVTNVHVRRTTNMRAVRVFYNIYVHTT